VNIKRGDNDCRNPTLGQVWGWSPTLPKLGTWSPPGLPNVQSSTARVKTPVIGVFLVSLERSSNVDIENGLALVIWTSAAQVMGKRRAKFDSRPLKVRNRPLPDVRFGSATWPWKALFEGYNFGSDLVPIGGWGEELWSPKVPRLQSGQFRDNVGTPFRESREKVTFGCHSRGRTQSIL
jgi:hypothetical protein